MITEHQSPLSSPRHTGQLDLARQDIEALLANLNTFESMVKMSIDRLRENILTTAVHLD